MASPFAILDQHRKKVKNVSNNGIKFPEIGTNKNISLEKKSSVLRNVNNDKQPVSIDIRNKENTSTIIKRPTLASVLRRESKFSSKSSVVSSKSRSIISKKITIPHSSNKRNIQPSSSGKISKSPANNNGTKSDRLKRELPWKMTITNNVHSTTKIKCLDDNKKNKNGINSNDHLVSIDFSYDGLNLSDEQRNVLDLILNKRSNVFFTGSAGTGKSFLLKLIIKKLQTRYGKSSIGVSAPTGLAAANIGGQTIQRLFGIGLGIESRDILLNRIKKNVDRYNVWRRMAVLVIDEISMLDSVLFDKLNYLAKKIKRNEKPFGGIQLIISGDFLQLPPITKFNTSNINYAFKSDSWSEIVDESIILSNVFRQSSDTNLIDILNNLRLGKVDHHVEYQLKKLNRELHFDDGIEPTELFPTRQEVELSNNKKLEQLLGPEITYSSEDISVLGLPIDDKIKKNLDLLNCVSTLKLKLGAQVMMIKNDVDSHLVNGQLGKVVAFASKPVLNSFNARFNHDYSNVNIEFLRKIGSILMNRKGITNLPSEDELSEFDPYTRGVMQEILRNFEKSQQLYPFVRFTLNNGSFYYLLIEPSEFRSSSRVDEGYIRKQLPLMLSWSMSIHKSQGQTLHRVRIDLRKIFEKGQLYVAISRCVSSDGLQVLNFDRRKVFVDEEVIAFYKSITG